MTDLSGWQKLGLFIYSKSSTSSAVSKVSPGVVSIGSMLMASAFLSSVVDLKHNVYSSHIDNARAQHCNLDVARDGTALCSLNRFTKQVY